MPNATDIHLEKLSLFEFRKRFKKEIDLALTTANVLMMNIEHIEQAAKRLDNKCETNIMFSVSEAKRKIEDVEAGIKSIRELTENKLNELISIVKPYYESTKRRS